jgi:uncharacterized protein with GYD domain
MPKYMYQASYTPEGFRGLLKDTASGRRKAVESAVGALGGKVEALYYAFGKYDVILIMELPDNVSAAGLAISVSASGMVRGSITPLITVEDADKALGVRVPYRGPGQA